MKFFVIGVCICCVCFIDLFRIRKLRLIRMSLGFFGFGWIISGEYYVMESCFGIFFMMFFLINLFIRWRRGFIRWYGTRLGFCAIGFVFFFSGKWIWMFCLFFFVLLMFLNFFSCWSRILLRFLFLVWILWIFCSLFWFGFLSFFVVLNWIIFSFFSVCFSSNGRESIVFWIMAIFVCVFRVSFFSVMSYFLMIGKFSVSVFSLIFVFCNLIFGVVRSNLLNWFLFMTFALAFVFGSIFVFVLLI